MDRLDYFANYAKGANTPQKLYEAIEKLGPLPRFFFVGTGSKRPSGELTTNKDDIEDRESAIEQANAIYEFALRIAIGIWKQQSGIPKPPIPKLKLKVDPFLGLLSISAWCLRPKKVKGYKFTAEDKLFAQWQHHPDWNNTRLAKAAGVNRTTPYKCKRFIAARKISKENGEYEFRRGLPKGSKDGETGTITLTADEAWDNKPKVWDEDYEDS